MRYLLTLPMLAALAFCGCDEMNKDRTDAPRVDVDVKGTPDLDPRTDHDVDIKTPDVDVDVDRTPDGLPDVDIDVKNKPDIDTKANETPGSDPDPNISNDKPADAVNENP